MTLPVNWTGEKQLDFLLKDTGSVAFSDIPEGVSYLVSAETENNYEVTIDSESGTISNIAPSSVSIVHKSETNLNTGISFDIIPYVIALGVVVCGLFLLSLRRKHEKNED